MTKATVMLRRKPRHITVNTFKPAIATLCHGNCDMQLVLNGYAAANYVTKYLTKENVNVGHAWFTFVDEALDNGWTPNKLLCKMGNFCINNREVGSQEAVDT
eukprot:1162154-Pelagomonas_calceolata.AAC.8